MNVVERSERGTLRKKERERERENSKRVMSARTVVAWEMHSSEAVDVPFSTKAMVGIKCLVCYTHHVQLL